MASDVEDILETVDSTQDKIKSFTRVALSPLVTPSQVVQLWRDELSRRLVISQDPLPLVYCCNDVLQESKGTQHDEYCSKFASILEADLRAILQEKPGLRKQVEKVITIWQTRQVFERPFIKRLRACIRPGDQPSDGEEEDTEDTRDQQAELKADTEKEHLDEPSSPQVLDPEELQREALASLSAAKLVALGDWIERELQSTQKLSQTSVQERIKRVKRTLETERNVTSLEDTLTNLKQELETMKARRRCLQASASAHSAARTALEKLVRRSEESMQRALEDLNQCDQVGKVLQALVADTSLQTLDARHRSMHLIPKRERRKQEVVQGPDLSNAKERVLKEGLTAEAAVKSERPLVYHKGLQKWIPLPSGDDSDNWRD